MAKLTIILKYLNEWSGVIEPTPIDLAAVDSSPRSAMCVGKTKLRKRCTRLIGKDARERIASLVKRLASHSTVEDLSRLLQKAAPNMLCPYHKDEQPLVIEALEEAIEKEKETKHRTDRGTIPMKSNHTERHVPLATVPTIQAQQKPDFIPYRTRPSSEAAAKRRVEDIKTRRFTRSEDEPGYIYFWSHPTFPGVLKIGKAKDVNKRLKRTSYTCKMELTPEIDPYQRRIRHVKRAEDIIHARLGLYRLKEQTPCACGSLHREYFDISREVALKRIEEVRTYMEKEYGVEGEDAEDAIWSPSPLK